MVSVAYGQGRIQRGKTRVRSMHPPTCHFQKCFQCLKFSVVSNHFNSDKPYPLSSGGARIFKRGGGGIISTFFRRSFFGRTNLKQSEKQVKL